MLFRSTGEKARLFSCFLQIIYALWSLFPSRKQSIISAGDNIDYMTFREADEKWGISPPQINYYCSAGRIPGAEKMGRVWLIPDDAEKPVDGRTKQGRALKHE